MVIKWINLKLILCFLKKDWVILCFKGVIEKNNSVKTM